LKTSCCFGRGELALQATAGRLQVVGRMASEKASKPTHGPTTCAEKYPQVYEFIKSPGFESIVGVVITLNCATIGLEVNGLVEENDESVDTLVGVCEHLFTLFFLGEFVLRILFCGWKTYVPMKDGPVSMTDAFWNLMDAGLVWITGVVFVWILQPLGVQGKLLRVCTALRAFRLFRLVRVVRKMPIFREVCLLIRGLADSGRTLFWTIIVMVFITYIFAVFGVVLISTEIVDLYDAAKPTDDDVGTLQQLVAEIGGVDNWMYTLIQVLTLDSWNGIARPLLIYQQWSWLFFYFYIAVAVIVFMNLVTAVIVENALASTQADEDSQLMLKKHEMAKNFKKFEELFQLMDQDQDGLLNYEEFLQSFQMPEVAVQLELLDFKPDECKMLFELLDEGDGTLTIEEFFQGLSQMKGEAQAKDVFMMSKRLDQIWRMICQAAAESAEDMALISHSLGARPSHRAGSLLRRSRGKVKAIDATTPTSTPAHRTRSQEEKESNMVASSSSQDRLDRLMAGLEGIRDEVASVSQQVNTLSTRLENVERSTQSLAKSMADMSVPRLQRSQWSQGERGTPVAHNGKPLHTPCEGFFSKPQ